LDDGSPVLWYKGYYFSLWNTLSLRQKHIAYDMAGSGFANYKNIYMVHHLIGKGLFRVVPEECCIKLFDESFCNFVMRTTHKSELKAFEQLNKQEGNWHSIRIILAVILLVLLVFISYVDVNVINKFVGILGSGVATLGLLGRALASVMGFSLTGIFKGK